MHRPSHPLRNAKASPAPPNSNLNATITAKEKEPLLDFELAIRMIDQCVTINYDQRVVAFRESQSTTNWSSLITAMHALQYWRQQNPDKCKTWALDLQGVGVGYWARALSLAQAEEFENGTDA